MCLATISAIAAIVSASQSLSGLWNSLPSWMSRYSRSWICCSAGWTAFGRSAGASGTAETSMDLQQGLSVHEVRLNADACVLDAGRPPQVILGDLHGLAVNPLEVILAKSRVRLQEDRVRACREPFDGGISMDVMEALQLVVGPEVCGRGVPPFDVVSAMVGLPQAACMVHATEEVRHILQRQRNQAVVAAAVVVLIVA